MDQSCVETARELTRLKAVNAELWGALSAITPEDLHGDDGGPLTCIVFMYEDGTERQLGHEPAHEARAALFNAEPTTEMDHG